MKTILSIVILSLISLTSLAGTTKKGIRKPNSVSQHDDIYYCKSSQSRLKYVANRTTGVLSMYEPDGYDADNLPDRIRKMQNLKVVREPNDDGPYGKNNIISYRFYKQIETLQRGTILRPVFEIEMEEGKGTSEIQYAEAKVMDVKITDENDFDVNLNCKSDKE